MNRVEERWTYRKGLATISDAGDEVRDAVGLGHRDVWTQFRTEYIESELLHAALSYVMHICVRCFSVLLNMLHDCIYYGLDAFVIIIFCLENLEV